jgi:hypothetical protein
VEEADELLVVSFTNYTALDLPVFESIDTDVGEEEVLDSHIQPVGEDDYFHEFCNS